MKTMYVPLIFDKDLNTTEYIKLMNRINTVNHGFKSGTTFKERFFAEIDKLDKSAQLNYTIEKETHWGKTQINKIV